MKKRGREREERRETCDEAVEVVAGYRALVIWRLIAVKLSLFPPSGAALGGVGRGWRGGDGAVSVRAHTLARACPSRSSPPSLPLSLPPSVALSFARLFGRSQAPAAA